MPLDIDLPEDFTAGASAHVAAHEATNIAVNAVAAVVDTLGAIDADLTTIAGLTPSNDDVLQRKSGAWTNRTPAQVKTDLALAKGDVGLGNVTNDAQVKLSTATTKGDIYVATGSGTVVRRAVGTAGQVLTVDAAETDGVKWATPSGGYTSEDARDDIATALVAGANVTITPNDGADTITIAASTSGSSGIPASTVDAKGDLIAGTANDTVARHAVGADGLALVAASGQTTGLTWAAPAPAAHAHGAADVTSGTVATARLGSGTASATTFLRGDQAYADPTLLAAAVHTVGNSSTSLAIDAASTSGWVKTITMTGNCTFTITGAVSGRVTTLELYLTQDGTGGRTATWPASVKWDGGTAPTLSTTAAAVDCIVLRTVNNGTTWLGNMAGKGYA